MDEKRQPIVSVAVTTYNSSKVVIETLDSIFNQTYKNIELIISDDCSTDNTVEICDEWIKLHEDRFVRTGMVTSKSNTGISANRNRAEKACRGEWIKVFDGDDIMINDCIESYISFVNQNKEAEFVFSFLKPFGGDEEYMKRVEDYSLSQKEFFQRSVKEQYDYLTLNSNRICGPTIFYNKKRMAELGVICDERIPLIDDWPHWVNLLKHGAHLYLMEKETMMYRMSGSSLSNQKVSSERFQKSRDLFFVYYQFREYYRHGRKKYALREYIRIKKEWGGWFWKQIYRLSKRVL